MLSPEAPLLEESLAVSALTLSVCSQFFTLLRRLLPPQLREGGRGSDGSPGRLPGAGPTQEPVSLHSSGSLVLLRATGI